LIDVVILGVLYAVLSAVLDPGLAYVLYLLANYTYFTVLEGGPSGQTVGKKAFGIRVIDFKAGGPIGYGRGLLRNLAKILSSIPIALGYLWMLWDPEKQTWHDKLATTASCRPTPTAPPDSAAGPGRRVATVEARGGRARRGPSQHVRVRAADEAAVVVPWYTAARCPASSARTIPTVPASC